MANADDVGHNATRTEIGSEDLLNICQQGLTIRFIREFIYAFGNRDLPAESDRFRMNRSFNRELGAHEVPTN